MKCSLVPIGFAPLCFLAAAACFAAPPRPAYLDPEQPLEVRAKDLVSRMTLDEKAAELMNTTPGVPRLGVPPYDWWNEALHGVARAGQATVFPQAIGLAATWDPALLHAVAGVIGVEGRAKANSAQAKEGPRYYGLTFWSPNVNIFRDPRWGRGQETYGEDPYLTSRLGVAFVQGLQGSDPRYLLAAACAKHFAVHSGPEPFRHFFNVAPPEADLFETYLPAFEALVREGRVAGVMTAYNALYGKPCAVNPLLYGLLDRWGFNGYVTSDCGAIEDLTRTYKLARDDAEAQALAVRAGLMVRCGDNPPALAEAVRRGLVAEAELDQQLARLLRTLFRLGFFDPASRVPYSSISTDAIDTPQHARLARQAAAESIVLLKNDGVLPLDRSLLKRVAIIGPNASSEAVLLGNYHGRPTKPVTILAGLRAALGPDVILEYARGCDYATGRGGLRPILRNALRNAEDSGLVGDYFANRELAGAPVFHRRAGPIDYDFAKAKLPAGVPSQGFSVRWTGELLTTNGGEYRLVIKADGCVRLKIGTRMLIDDWRPESKTVSVTATLPENAALPITLEYSPGNTPGRITLLWDTPPPDAGMQKAVEIARRADAVIFVGGINAQFEGESMTVDYDGFFGGDRTAIELPSIQQHLLTRLAGVGKPLICVLMSGSALATPWADQHANAVLEAWYPGQAGGAAVADVLLGAVNPSGRLPVTFYRATTDLPPFADYRMAGRTYRYFAGAPLYPFGHGLSYTHFDYSALNVSLQPHLAEAALTVAVDVRNAGAREGDEVVQVYLTAPQARERLALAAFARIHLTAGEARHVEIAVPATSLRRWNAQTHAYAVPTGEWTVRVGASSADIRETAHVRL